MILFKSYQIYIFYQSGRVISDPGRGIALIEWSEAGYPLRIITDAGEHIRYRYSASGVKLSESYLDAEGTPLGTRELCGCFELADGKVNRVHVPGGYLDPLWKLHLYVPDYQGSIIGVVDTSTGYPEQVTNYYPYGTPHASGMGEAVNRRAFGGKEYTREFGVHSLDFGARPYSPLTGSFLQPDPLAGNLTAISPYAYCAGDPVNLTDPTGCEIRGVSKKDAKLVEEDFRDMFPGEVFSDFRELITRTGKKHNGKSLAPISQESLSQAFAGITLNEDQQALVDMVVNTINSESVHKVEYLFPGKNLSFSTLETFAKRSMSNPEFPKEIAEDYNLYQTIIQNTCGEGATAPTLDGSVSIIMSNSDEHLITRAATVGHEIIGHGRTHSLGLTSRFEQHVYPIQIENLIGRMMRINKFRNGTDHAPLKTFIPNYSSLPNFR